MADGIERRIHAGPAVGSPTHWSTVQTPAEGHDSSLSGIACTSASSCWAVDSIRLTRRGIRCSAGMVPGGQRSTCPAQPTRQPCPVSRAPRHATAGPSGTTSTAPETCGTKPCTGTGRAGCVCGCRAPGTTRVDSTPWPAPQVRAAGWSAVVPRLDLCQPAPSLEWSTMVNGFGPESGCQRRNVPERHHLLGRCLLGRRNQQRGSPWGPGHMVHSRVAQSRGQGRHRRSQRHRLPLRLELLGDWGLRAERRVRQSSRALERCPVVIGFHAHSGPVRPRLGSQTR